MTLSPEERDSLEAGMREAQEGRTYTYRCKHASPHVCHECLVLDCERWYALGRADLTAIAMKHRYIYMRNGQHTTPYCSCGEWTAHAASSEPPQLPFFRHFREMLGEIAPASNRDQRMRDEAGRDMFEILVHHVALPNGKCTCGFRFATGDAVQYIHAFQEHLRTVTGEFKLTNSELADNERSFDLRWTADMRGIKMWQAAHPDKLHTWPDHADLVVWLLEQLDDLKNNHEHAEWIIRGTDVLIAKIQAIVCHVLGAGSRSADYDVLDRGVREAIEARTAQAFIESAVHCETMQRGPSVNDDEWRLAQMVLESAAAGIRAKAK